MRKQNYSINQLRTNKITWNGEELANLDLLLRVGAAGRWVTYRTVVFPAGTPATQAVVTGLASIDGFALTPITGLGATPANAAVSITGKAAAGTLTIYRWKHTGPSTTTLTAATTGGTVSLLAVGTL